LDMARIEYGSPESSAFDFGLAQSSAAVRALDDEETSALGLAAIQVYEAMRSDVPCSEPVLPKIWFGFEPDSPPVFERSEALFVTAGIQPGSLDPEAELAALTYTWNAARVTRDGLDWWPQIFFSRDLEVNYTVHPIDGTPVPRSGPGKTRRERLGNWIGVNGVWFPKAQRPSRIAANCGDLAGGAIINPAFSVLRAIGLIETPTYPVWFKASTEASIVKIVDAIAQRDSEDSTFLPSIYAEMRRRIGSQEQYVTDDDLARGLIDPKNSISASRKPRAQVIEIEPRLLRSIGAMDTLGWASSSATLTPVRVPKTALSHFFGSVASTRTDTFRRREAYV
jgi:hypothetical protein